MGDCDSRRESLRGADGIFSDQPPVVRAWHLDQVDDVGWQVAL